MSTGSISALGILTNSEPLRGISITKDDAKNGKKDEVKLIFLGTFFHEDSNVSMTYCSSDGFINMDPL